MGAKECKERLLKNFLAKEVPPPPPVPRRYTSSVDWDALILAELREIKTILKDRM